MNRTSNALPSSATWLGLAGVLPQLVACVAGVTNPQWSGFIGIASFAYASLIFSFLGGLWWGVGLTTPKTKGWIFTAAVCPSLVAWGGALAIYAEPKWWPTAMGVVAIGLIISPLVDVQIAKSAPLPEGWIKLRWTLSVGLGFLTLAIAVFLRHAII